MMSEEKDFRLLISKYHTSSDWPKHWKRGKLKIVVQVERTFGGYPWLFLDILVATFAFLVMADIQIG